MDYAGNTHTDTHTSTHTEAYTETHSENRKTQMIGKRNGPNKIHKCCQIIGSPNLGPNAQGVTKGKCARGEKGEREKRDEAGAAGIGRHLSILLAKRFNVYSVASCLNICGIFAKTTKCHAHTHAPRPRRLYL